MANDKYSWREFDTEELAVAFSEGMEQANTGSVSDIDVRCQPLKPCHWIVCWWEATDTPAISYPESTPWWDD